ncbi:uncharacterized protein [Muntiacus reevesi]|uniref:uncharacterized protein isoform X2 n=1 Tax=Muntiacus reevesi TaxID=9886 RepID=UPI0033073592
MLREAGMERMGMEPVVPWVPPLGNLVDARRGLKVLSVLSYALLNGTFQSGWFYRYPSVPHPRTELFHLVRPLRMDDPPRVERQRRNMSGQVASTLGPTGQDSSQLDEPVVDQQPSVEQPQQEEPPAEIQDITPGTEEVSGEDPVNHDEEKEKDAPGDSDVETHLQELAVAKTGGQGGDGPDVEEEIVSNTETVEMPEEVKGNHLLERR